MADYDKGAILVTGASGGIGGETVRLLRQKGADVIAAGQNAGELHRPIAGIIAGGQGKPLALPPVFPQQCRLEGTKARLGRRAGREPDQG